VPDVVLASSAVARSLSRLDRPWPDAAALVNHRGEPFTLASLGGRGALVTFAFGHCETVCPAVVHEARAARLALADDVSIVVLTLDPWRDVPSRLPAIHGQFQLDPLKDHVVGGTVDAVEAALDAWEIARQRDLRSGDIVHPALVYLVETDGTLAFASGGARVDLIELAQRMEWRNDAP
jgi:protein SCO1/2